MAAVRETQAQQLARLEAENARLAQELRTARAAAAQARTATTEPQPPVKRGGRGRTIASVALLVVGALLAPVGILANTVQRVLTDPEVFVSTVSSSLDDPAVQDYISDQLVIAIREGANLDQLTSDLFAGIQELDLSPAAKRAAAVLEGPVTAGMNAVLEQAVHRVVSSPQFADIVRQSLRITHEQLVKTLTGAEGAAITIGPGGTISLSLGPILAQVKVTLQDRGVAIANIIPETDREIPIATVAQIEQLATAYQVAIVVGAWLPWIVLLLFAAAVVVARRRSTMAFAAGLVLAGVAGIVGIVISFGRVIATSALAQYIPVSAGGPIYDGLVKTTVDLVVVLIVLGLAVALVAFLAAPWRPSRAIRSFGDASADSLAAFAEGHGITTGAFGDFLRQWRFAIRVGIGVVAAAIIVFVRPLSPALIIWTLVIALLLVVLARLLERPETPGEPGLPEPAVP